MPVAFDCETFLIEPGVLAPLLVCLTAAWTGSPPVWVPTHDPAAGVLVERDDAGGAALLTADAVTRPVVEGLLGEALAVAANAPFDLLVLAAHVPGVLPAVFAAVRDARVADVQVRERLILNARGELEHGRVALADLVYRYLGEEPGRAIKATKGPDAWRMRYAELDGLPLEEWPEAATAYALDDARATLRVFEAQSAQTPRDVGGFPLVRGGRVVSEDRELRAAWALHLQAAWGLRTDPAAVEALVETWTTTAEAGKVAGLAGGWIRGPGSRPASKVGTLDKKILQGVVSAAYGGHPPRTKPCGIDGCTKAQKHDGDHGVGRSGQVKTDTDTLIEVAERPGTPPTLRAYADSLQAARYLKVWGPPLRAGVERPVTYRVTHLKETGRVSIAEPPLHQPPRSGGVRECFIPRPGYVYCSADYHIAELCALAQVHRWLGLGSTMADAINAGQDLHLVLAAAVRTAEGTPTTYAEARRLYKAGDVQVKHLRQVCKNMNFGFAGGLGAPRFVEYVGAQGITISLEDAQALRATWLSTWPEMRPYFGLINRMLDGRDSFVVQHPVSGRLRGGVGYTDGANGYFQGLVADISKDAAWRLAREAYLVRESPFYGSRVVLHLHDELIAEVPVDRASAAGDRMAEVMVEAWQAHCPDVVSRAEPALMARWAKDAETVRDEAGHLVVWVPPPPRVRDDGTTQAPGATEASP